MMRSRTCCSWAAEMRGMGFEGLRWRTDAPLSLAEGAYPCNRSGLDMENGHSLWWRGTHPNCLESRPMFNAWGRFIYRFRRPVAILAIVIAGASSMLASQVTGALSAGGWTDPGSESAAVSARL